MASTDDEVPDSVRIWEMDDGPELGEEELSAAFDSVHRALEQESLDDDLIVVLASGYPLISGRALDRVPEPTRAAMHAAAVVGYFCRETDSEREGRPRTRPSYPIREIAQRAAQLASDPEIDAGRAALRERLAPIRRCCTN